MAVEVREIESLGIRDPVVDGGRVVGEQGGEFFIHTVPANKR